MSFLIRLLLCLLLLAPLAAPAAEPVVLVLGDSLSAAYGIERERGWVSLLGQRLQRAGYPHRVVNASVSGETTSGGLARLPRALQRHQPQVVIVALGANDGLRGIAREEMRANLGAIIEQSREHGASVLLVGMRLPPNYGAEYVERFHAVYSELASSRKVPLVPFLLEGLVDGEAPDESLLQADGIHPVAEAQPLLLETVWPDLKPLLTSP